MGKSESLIHTESVQHTTSRSRRYDDRLRRHTDRIDRSENKSALKRGFEDGAWARIFLATNPTVQG